MDTFQKIIDAKDDEIDSIIDSSINELVESTPDIGTIGFINGMKCVYRFRGFIPLHTRIKYSTLNIEDYGMETTDYIYDFAHFIKSHNIKDKNSLINALEYFALSYFGDPSIKTKSREEIFDPYYLPEDEYFAAIANNKLGDLKGTGSAQCTEFTALAQQILSVFGFEVHYCSGYSEFHGKSGAHAFNIIKSDNGYAILDYSIPVISYKSDGRFNTYFPFVAKLSENDFADMLVNSAVRTFDEYVYYCGEHKSISNGNQRVYAVGKFALENEKSL